MTTMQLDIGIVVEETSDLIWCGHHLCIDNSLNSSGQFISFEFHSGQHNGNIFTPVIYKMNQIEVCKILFQM